MLSNEDKVMNGQEVVLFLGAGFSCEAHQPIMNKFGEFSKAQLRGSNENSYAGGFKGIDTQKKYDSYQTLKSCGEKFEALRKYCRENSAFTDFDANNMEDLFTYVEMRDMCSLPDLQLEIRDKANNITNERISNQELLEAIKIWLWQIFRRVPINRPKRWSLNKKCIDREPYIAFINALKNYGFDKISILTTNYDLIIEFLCNYIDSKVYYAIEKYEPESITEHTYGNFGSKNNNKQSLTLCKLHGSVNFFEHNDDSNKFYIISDLGGKIKKSSVKETVPAVSALDAAIHILKDKSLFPAIIPPSYAKMQKCYWLNDVWHYASKSLKNAQKWIFIGYSFPPSDGHINTLINLALINKKDRPKVIVVSPSSDIIRNYKRLIDENFTFYRKEFSDFIRSGDFKKEIYN